MHYSRLGGRDPRSTIETWTSSQCACSANSPFTTVTGASTCRPPCQRLVALKDPQYLTLSPDVTVDWHRAADLVEHLLDDGVDAQLASDLLPLLRTGDLLDRWVERWVTNDRDRYHAMRKTAFAAIAGSCTPASRTS